MPASSTGDPRLAEAGEQVVKGVAGDRRIDAAERVIGAEFDDDCVGILAERPVDPGGAVAGCVPGNPGIDDRDIVAARSSRRLEPGRVKDSAGSRP